MLFQANVLGLLWWMGRCVSWSSHFFLGSLLDIICLELSGIISSCNNYTKFSHYFVDYDAFSFSCYNCFHAFACILFSRHHTPLSENFPSTGGPMGPLVISHYSIDNLTSTIADDVEFLVFTTFESVFVCVCLDICALICIG